MVEIVNDSWLQLARILPVSDLSQEAADRSTDAAETQMVHRWIESSYDRFDEISGALYRHERGHVLLAGLRGVGKTATLKELARRVFRKEYRSLVDRRFLWIDCRHIGPEDSRACLELIFAATLGQSGIILCVDGIANLLRRANGGTNRPLICSLISRSDIRLIGTLAPWEFSDLVAGDAEIRQLFTRIELQESDAATTHAIAQSHAKHLAREFALTLDSDLVRRTVQYTSHFLLNEQHPAKALSVLLEACERLAFSRQQGETNRSDLRLDDVIAVLAGRTAIPPETIAGSGGDTDFEATLGANVVGQSHPIEVVAGELRLIKAGLADPGKPASVMLFAGMTGVGKTELAKRIAEVYSSSRRLQVYSMGNFTESHSVSGIIGVPPGYVGHDQGGRLINDLNADPYSVFLLDEAEKCHPDIWKPFLNLFDEGWIVDQRGVKAYADRAIFILTTNAGDQHVAQMTTAGRSEEQIIEAVRQTLSQVKSERSSQPVFPAQFISRLRRIVVFRPLDETAMIGICDRACRRLVALWREKRDLVVEIDSNLREAIGKLGHKRNQPHQQDGGRIIQRLIDELIQDPLQQWTLAEKVGKGETALRVSLKADASSSATDLEALRESIVVMRIEQ